jgi:8-oxo-dGTP pyrophosphatase MutT (NUDIX family)
MQWKVHGERSIYSSEWMALHMVDVELPDGARFEHHVIRGGRPAAGALVHSPDKGILLLYRHRFTVDKWGWEIPAGMVDDGETPLDAARREVLEESGWRITGNVEPLCSFEPMSGSADKVFHTFIARSAEHVGEPTDVNEASKIEWVPVERVREMVRVGEIHESMTLVAVLYAVTFGLLD